MLHKISRIPVYVFLMLNSLILYVAETHADYQLPYPAGTRYMVQQGNNEQYSHKSGTKEQYAWDFGGSSGGAKIGDPIVAARSGRVYIIEEDFPDNGKDDKNLANFANRVIIDHEDEDGTYALYPSSTEFCAIISWTIRTTRAIYR